MGTSLSVKHDGSWRTVDEPYIKVDDTWKTVHNVWLKHGGSWRLAHKTALDQYVEYTDSGVLTNSDTITIAESVRYIKVRLIGSGGSAGSGIGTGLNAWGVNHLQCPFGLSNFSSETAAGGNGGAGALVDVILEVKSGEEYTYTYGGSGGNATGAANPFATFHYVVYGIGHSGSGSAGSTGGSMSFVGPNNTNLIAAGGGGGTAGSLAITAECYGSGFRAQTIGVTNGSTGSTGTTTVSSDNLTSTVSNTAGGGGANGTGGQNAGGSGGGGGSIQIWQYRASTY